MLVLKITGTILIILAGGGLSIAAVRYEHKRLTAIDGFISLIMRIKGQIDCCAMPVAEILAGTDRELLTSCMSNGRAKTFGEVLDSCPILLGRECTRLLRGFSSELGSLYRDEQLRRCDYYTEALSAERGKIAEAIPARVRLISAIVMCGAAGIAVILW